jgi:multiple sugar transport system permease protein
MASHSGHRLGRLLPRSRPRRGSGLNSGRLALAFLAPAGVLVIVVIGIPLARAAQLSLTNTQLLSIHPGSFVGLANFAQALGDPAVGKAIGTSIAYVAATVAGGLLVGMGMAQILERLPTRLLWIRALLLTPWITPAVVVALLFSYMFDVRVSVVGFILQSLGILTKNPAWLTSTALALPVVVVATIWTQAPIFMLFISAALRGVSSEIRDAATVDGAAGWASFRHITVPLTKRVLLVVTILMTIQNLNGFPLIWGLTQGGPVDATTTTVINVYRTAFEDNQIGYAAAIGMLLLLMTLVASAIYIRVMRQAD